MLAVVTYYAVAWMMPRNNGPTSVQHIAVEGAPETLCNATVGEILVPRDGLHLCVSCQARFKSDYEWSRK